MLNEDYSLSGVTGYCIIEGDKIIKIYTIPMYDVEDLSKYHSERISFPYEYLKKRRNVIGEVLPYFNILNIMDGINDNSNIDKLIDNYHIICREIALFPKIIMHDLSYPNILYEEDKGFYIIDVTNWRIDNSTNSKSYDINIESLNDSILYCLWKKIVNDIYDEEWIKEKMSKEF